jgi:hypothetical protein
MLRGFKTIMFNMLPNGLNPFVKYKYSFETIMFNIVSKVPS